MAIAVDIGLLVIVLLSTVAGARSGFSDTLFSLASWIGAALVALYVPRLLVPQLPATIRAFPGIAVLAGVLLFLVAFFLIRVLGMVISGDGKGDAGPLDRLLGLILGFGRGFLLAAVVGSFLVAYLPPNGSVVRRSQGLPIVKPVGRLVAQIAPGGLHSRMLDGWGRLDKDSAPHKGPVTI